MTCGRRRKEAEIPRPNLSPPPCLGSYRLQPITPISQSPPSPARKAKHYDHPNHRDAADDLITDIHDYCANHTRMPFASPPPYLQPTASSLQPLLTPP